MPPSHRVTNHQHQQAKQQPCQQHKCLGTLQHHFPFYSQRTGFTSGGLLRRHALTFAAACHAAGHSADACDAVVLRQSMRLDTERATVHLEMLCTLGCDQQKPSSGRSAVLLGNPKMYSATQMCAATATFIPCPTYKRELFTCNVLLCIMHLHQLTTPTQNSVPNSSTTQCYQHHQQSSSVSLP
jgi:hypothetical protein